MKTNHKLSCRNAQQRMRSLGRKQKAHLLQRFFKTGKGEYGEGDRFLGVMVPVTRRVAREFFQMPLSEIRKLLHSPMHEERLLALILLVMQFKKGEKEIREKIFHLYLKEAKWINNWDLVDVSARDIVGFYLEDKDRGILDHLARSKNLWERRIAVIATLHFIRLGQFDDTIRLCKVLMFDTEDLMHKACGWTLREVGKKEERVLRHFLNNYAAHLPRTMLRYAIEKFPPKDRIEYLKKRNQSVYKS